MFNFLFTFLQQQSFLWPLYKSSHGQSTKNIPYEIQVNMHGRVVVSQTLKIRQVKSPLQCQRYRCLNLYRTRLLMEVAQHQRPSTWQPRIIMIACLH